MGRGLAGAAAFLDGLAAVHQGTEEGARRQDHGFGQELFAALQTHAADLGPAVRAGGQHEALDRGRAQLER